MTIPLSISNVVHLPVARMSRRSSLPPSSSPATAGNGHVNGNGNGHGSRTRSSAPSPSPVSPSPPSPSVPVSLNPSHFSAPFDVIEELARHREQYAGTDMFTVTRMPSPVRISLDRTRARAWEAASYASSKPGLSPTASACIENGVALLAGDDRIISLLQLRHSLDKLPSTVRAGGVEELYTWLSSLAVALPAGRRMNVSLPDHVKRRLFDLAHDVGIAASDLAILAIMQTMTDQACVIEDHAEEMGAGVGRFLRQVELKVRVGQELLRWVGGGGGGEIA